MAMRGLPDLQYGRPQVRPVGVVGQDTGAGDMFRALASNAAQLGEMALEQGVENAKKAGEKAVTRDANGQIVVQKSDYLLPVMDHAYENAAELRYATETAKDLDRDLADAHMKHALDPEGFDAAVQGIKEGYLGKLPNPDWANKINDLIDRESGQHLSNIRNTKFAADIKKAGGAIDAKIERNINDLDQLVRQGALHTPEAEGLVQQGVDLINSKVGNPAFADYTQEQADLDIQEFKSQLEVSAISAEAEKIFREKGYDAAQEWANKALGKPVEGDKLAEATEVLKLTPQEQFLYQHHLDTLNSGKAVKNEDGSVSTVRVGTFDIDGKSYALPTVWDGKIIEDPNEIVKRAEAVGLDKFPSYATEEEANKRYGDIHGYIEGDKPDFDLTPDVRDKAEHAIRTQLRQLETDRRSDVAQLQDKNYTDMDLAADLGKLSLPDVEKARSKGLISESAARSLNGKIITKDQTDQELMQALGMVNQSFPMDPQNATHRKAVSKIYDQQVAGGADPVKTAVNMAVTNGIVPDRAVSTIRAASLSNDPKVAAQGLALGREVITNAPDALDRMPGGTAVAKEVEIFRHRTRDMGFTDGEAAQFIIEQRNPANIARNKVVVEAQQDNINKLTADDALEGMRSKTWAGWWMGTPEGGFTPAQSSEIANDYKALVTEHLKATGDMDSAKALAGLDMARTYGETMVEGARTLMKYPPERKYPKVNGSWDYVRQQAVEEARTFTKSETLGSDDVVLLPDGVTANDWARQGALPRYGLAVKQTVNGEDVWMTLPGGYFVADPKRATTVEALQSGAAMFAAGTPDPMSGMTQRVESKPAAPKTPEQQFAEKREAAKKSLDAAKAAAAAPDIMSGFTSPETGPATAKAAPAVAKPGGSAAPTGESRLHAQLKRDEQGNKGPALKPYKDAHGQSIGWGHFIKPGEEHLKKGITREQAEELFKQDVQDATNDLQDNYPKLWNAAETPNRKEALINMMFNMGMGNKDRGFSSFTKSIPLMEQGKWTEAAENLKKSKWYKQTGDRAKRVIKMLVEG